MRWNRTSARGWMRYRAVWTWERVFPAASSEPEWAGAGRFRKEEWAGETGVPVTAGVGGAVAEALLDPTLLWREPET